MLLFSSCRTTRNSGENLAPNLVPAATVVNPPWALTSSGPDEWNQPQVQRHLHRYLGHLQTSLKKISWTSELSALHFRLPHTVKYHLFGRHLSEHVGYPTVGSTKYFDSLTYKLDRTYPVTTGRVLYVDHTIS